MSFLDDLTKIKKIDKKGLADLIAELPNQCLEAYHKAQKTVLPQEFLSVKRIIIAGMGAPVLGGEIAYTTIEDQLKIPATFCRSWQLPKNIDKHTLIILVSFSGETRETLSCFDEAREKGAKIFVISGEGKLKEMAKKYQLSLFTFSHSGPSRAVLGFFIMPILVILEKLNLINLAELQIERSLKLLTDFSQKFKPKVAMEKNIAKYLAYFIFNHCPLILAPKKLLAVARRWKNEFNENAKNFAFFEELPEVFHNTIEAYLPWRLKDEFVILILESPDEPREHQKSLRYLKDLLKGEDIRYEFIPGLAGNIFVNILSLILIGDWTSFYLAILNNQNPTPVKKIDWLKSQLL